MNNTISLNDVTASVQTTREAAKTARLASAKAEFERITQNVNTVIFNGKADYAALFLIADYIKSAINPTIWSLPLSVQKDTLTRILADGLLMPKWKMSIERVLTPPAPKSVDGLQVAIVQPALTLDTPVTFDKLDLAGFSDANKAKILIARDRLLKRVTDDTAKKAAKVETLTRQQQRAAARESAKASAQFRAAQEKLERRERAEYERKAKKQAQLDKLHAIAGEKLRAQELAQKQFEDAIACLPARKWKPSEVKKAYLEGSYYFEDTDRFYVPTEGGEWLTLSQKKFEEGLFIRAGLNAGVDKTTGISAAGKVRYEIETNPARKLDGVVCFNWRPQGFLSEKIVGSRRILNVSVNRTMKPGDELTPWGAAGKFPWISDFLDNFFGASLDGAQQKEMFLATLRRHYLGALSNDPKLCPVMFFGGDEGAGKGFLTRRILAKMYGGNTADPTDFLRGAAIWNDDLVESTLWVANDPVIGSHEKGKSSKLLKTIASEAVMTASARFTTRHEVEQYCLKCFSLNLDPVSKSALITNGLTSKVQVYRVFHGKKDKSDFANGEALASVELPFFLAWLILTPPATWTDTKDPRYGVPCRIHDEFAAESAYSAETGDVLEILELLFENWTSGVAWKGNATSFLKLCELNDIAVRLPLRQIGEGLSMIARREPGIVKFTTVNGTTRYTITPPVAAAKGAVQT